MESSTDVDASLILEKGPDYLRKQMDLESDGNKGRMSAVERLAATKVQYVKSPQVVKKAQDPIINLDSSPVSSQGSSKRCNRNPPVNPTVVTARESSPSDNVVRRSSSKKRPDSLLLYRQKCDLLRGTAGERRRRRMARKTLLRSLKDKGNTCPEAKESDSEGEQAAKPGKDPEERTELPTITISCPEGTPGETKEEDSCLTSELAGETDVPHKKSSEVVPRSGKGVARSHSDISSRYSKNFANFDSFFKYCGLESDVIEGLGRENFSSHSEELCSEIRTLSVAASDDGLSRTSGDSDGLQEGELQETINQGTSVIERNARIIKWLYSCKNASQSGKALRDLDI